MAAQEEALCYAKYIQHKALLNFHFVGSWQTLNRVRVSQSIACYKVCISSLIPHLEKDRF